QLGNFPLQVRCCVQVSKRRCRCRVSVIVRRNVDRLNRSNGALLRGSNPFLKLTHLRCECRLVTYRRRHPAEKSGYFGTRLREAEDVVDEQQHVAAFFIAEELSHCKTRQCNAKTRPWRLVHLAEYHRC